jgi:acyl carrier protein
MSNSDVRAAVIEALASVAPEAANERLADNVLIRDQLDFDSMDHLNFVIALHERFGIDIPERDYPKLATLDACVRYVETKRSGA